MTFEVTVEAADGQQVTIRVAGVMDAEMDLTRLEDQLRRGGRVVLDLGDVLRINSAGVREWMRFIRSVGPNVELVRCPPAFVDQINHIYGFLGSAAVRSIQVPFCCPTCDASKTAVVETAVIAARDPDPLLCDECGDEMECDVLPDSYFGFLRGT